MYYVRALCWRGVCKKSEAYLVKNESGKLQNGNAYDIHRAMHKKAVMREEGGRERERQRERKTLSQLPQTGK